MKINEKFGKGKTVFSLEVFPPKKDKPIESITNCLEELALLTPDFISVTYGAGGSLSDNRTAQIAGMIESLGVTAMAHLTCVTSSRADVLAILSALRERGVDNILALRGDITPSLARKEDFTYASDLAKFIRENGDFGISGACYPETHLEAESLEKDIENLKIKVDSGVSHLITQLFFDNECFYRFREMTAAAGIDVPIEAGIMPVINAKQIENMVTMCGASLPSKFTRTMQKFGQNRDAMFDAGIAYAVDQITDLIAAGTAGIHLYTMNNPTVARRIFESIKNLL
jgi:methylenetetrahydrofolate reductase (NADPH)